MAAAHVRRHPTRSRNAGTGAELHLRTDQVELAELLAAGCSTTRVAAELGLSVDRARRRIAELKHDVGATTTIQAVVTCVRAGVL